MAKKMNTSVVNGASDPKSMQFAQPSGGFQFAAPQSVPNYSSNWEFPPTIPPNPYPSVAPSNLGFLAPSDKKAVTTVNNCDPSYLDWLIFEFDAVADYLGAGVQIGLIDAWYNPFRSNQYLAPIYLPHLLSASIQGNRDERGYTMNQIFNQDPYWDVSTGNMWFARKTWRNMVEKCAAMLAAGNNQFEPAVNSENFSNPLAFLPFNPFTNVPNPDWFSNVQGIFDVSKVTSRADYYRVYAFVSTCYNNYNSAYGDMRKLNPFAGGYNSGPNFWQRLWSGIKRVFPLMVVGRNACLGLIELNFTGAASKMHPKLGDNLKRSWEGFGGNYSSLVSSINQGKNKPPILGDPASIAVLIAAGTPIILALLAAIKEGGDATEILANAATSAIGSQCVVYQQQVQNLVDSFVQDNTPEEVATVLAALGLNVPGIEACGAVNDYVDDLLGSLGVEGKPPPISGPPPQNNNGTLPEAPQNNGASPNVPSPNNSTSVLLLGGLAIFALSQK